MDNNEMTQDFIKTLKKAKVIKKIFKKRDEELKNKLKENIDSNYLKLSGISDKGVYFKANKKMRNKLNKNPEFYKEYILELFSKIFALFGVDIDAEDLEVISDLWTEEVEHNIMITIEMT